MAYLFCAQFEGSNNCEFRGGLIAIKMMQPKLQRTRFFYLGEAKKLILAKSPDCGAEIKWEDRKIYTPDNNVVFEQPKKVVTGNFYGNFASLSFTSK